MVFGAEPYLPLQLGGLGLIAVLAAYLLRSSKDSTDRVDRATDARVTDLRNEIKRALIDRNEEHDRCEREKRALRDQITALEEQVRKCWQEHRGLNIGDPP